MNECPCFTENVSRWPMKRPRDWTEAERMHVWNLVHDYAVKHFRGIMEMEGR